MAQGIGHSDARRQRLSATPNVFPAARIRVESVLDRDDERSSDLGDQGTTDMPGQIDDPSEDLIPSAPQVRDYSEVDAPRELRNEFWAQVILFNVALFAVSLGLMFVGFEGRWELGGGLVLVGLFAFARGYHRYRAFQADAEESDADESDED